MARLNYVELPVRDIEASRRFFETVLGWELTAFAPTYAGTVGQGTDIGLQGDPAEVSAAPLPVIEVDDLDAMLVAVQAAGGVVTRPIFSFPGGRRFHFREPSGSELAIWAMADAASS